MFKLATLAVLSGLAMSAATLPSMAQVAAPGGKPSSPSVNDTECAYQLNYMPRVTRSQVAAINGQPVHLVPVCEDKVAGELEDYGWLFVAGNVDTLRLPIARNATLMRALDAEGYDQHDVVSLRFAGGNTITLYVHQRSMK